MPTRVTSLGKLLPIGQFFLKETKKPKFYGNFFPRKSYVFNLTKDGFQKLIWSPCCLTCFSLKGAGLASNDDVV
jgi:hypothetical protein